MWRERPLPPLNPDFGGDARTRRLTWAATTRPICIGPRIKGRVLPSRTYHQRPPMRAAVLPVIIEACQEEGFRTNTRWGYLLRRVHVFDGEESARLTVRLVRADDDANGERR